MNDRDRTTVGGAGLAEYGQETLQVLLDSLDDFAFVLDLGGTLRYVNQRLLVRLGIPVEELIGRPCTRIVAPEHHAEATQLIEAMQTSHSQRCDLPLSTQAGESIPVETRMSRLRVAEEPLLLAIARDVTEQRKAVADLQRERDLVRAILESSPLPITIFTLDGIIQDCNRAAWRGNGCESKEELIGLSVTDFFPADRREEVPRVLERTYKEGRLRGLRYDLVDAAGQAYPAEVSVAVLRGPGGEPAGFVSMVLNVADREHMQAELAQAQRMESVGRLAGGVAHDFNNILTAIRGYAKFALDNLAPEHTAHADVQEVLAATERASNLTRQLLAFSRRQLLRPMRVKPAALLLDMSTMLRRIVASDIELVILPEEGLWEVMADTGQIEQVIVALVMNARDAMPTGGKIIIQATNQQLADGADLPEELPAGEYVVMTVTDTGPGIPEENLGRIFDPFYTTHEQGSGAGLGLASVYGIMRQHGGSVTAANGAEGGARFRILLPRADSAQAEVPHTSPRDDLPQGDETVLVVEDEPLVKAVTVRNLVGLGYTVLEADNGEEALRVAATIDGPLHLLVTDVVMPKLGGKELVERLRADHPDLKALFVSGYTDDVILRHGVQTGQVAFLQKPFSLRRLAFAVREALAQ